MVCLNNSNPPEEIEHLLMQGVVLSGLGPALNPGDGVPDWFGYTQEIDLNGTYSKSGDYNGRSSYKKRHTTWPNLAQSIVRWSGSRWELVTYAMTIDTVNDGQGNISTEDNIIEDSLHTCFYHETDTDCPLDLDIRSWVGVDISSGILSNNFPNGVDLVNDTVDPPIEAELSEYLHLKEFSVISYDGTIQYYIFTTFGHISTGYTFDIDGRYMVAIQVSGKNTAALVCAEIQTAIHHANGHGSSVVEFSHSTNAVDATKEDFVITRKIQYPSVGDIVITDPEDENYGSPINPGNQGDAIFFPESLIKNTALTNVFSFSGGGNEHTHFGRIVQYLGYPYLSEGEAPASSEPLVPSESIDEFVFPVLDEYGNPTYDGDGNLITQSKPVELQYDSSSGEEVIQPITTTDPGGQDGWELATDGQTYYRTIDNSSSSTTSPTFMGLAITGFTSTVGWGGDSTDVTIQLADQSKDVLCENTAGFVPGQLGTPRTFTYGGFSFRGLLHNWEKTSGMNGTGYVVRLKSPSQVLKNAKLVLKGLSDAPWTGGSNIFVVNPSTSWCVDYGPTWSECSSAIGTIRYKDVNYSVNVSQIGATGLRFDGDSVDVMTACERAAAAAGKQIYVHLVGNTITIQASSTAQSPQAAAINQSISNLASGAVANAANSTSNLINWSRGVEDAESVSFAALNGDFEKTVATCSNVKQFWGFDEVSGNPIFSNNTPANGDDESFTVNTSHSALVSACTGGAPYTITVLELRAAMAGYESWLNYAIVKQASSVQRAGGPDKNPFITDDEALTAFLTGGDAMPATCDILNTSASHAKFIAQGQRQGTTEKLHALHEFVKSFSQFYGQKFGAMLPAPIGGCGEKTNYEKTDGGWSEGSVLGITPPAQFKSDDNRIGAFVGFVPQNKPSFSTGSNDGVYRVDATAISSPWYYTGGKLYLKATVEEIKGRVAIISVGGGVNMRPEGNDNIEDSLDEALLVFLMKDAIPGLKTEKLEELIKNLGASELKGLSLSTGMHNRPLKAAVPVKSNFYCYGPWFASSDADAGRSEYQGDSSYNPWNFAGSSFMNTVAAYQVSGMITGASIVESGSIRYHGLPSVSLAQAISSGPNITSINVAIGMQGTITTIQMRTFVPNFGELHQSRLSMMKRAGMARQKMQRAFDQRASQRMAMNTNRFIGGMVLNSIERGQSQPKRGATPDGGGGLVMIGSTVPLEGVGGAESGRGNGGGSGDKEDMPGNHSVVANYSNAMGESYDSWQKRAGGDASILFRPFTVNHEVDGMPKYDNSGTSSGGSSYSDPPVVDGKSLDPYMDKAGAGEYGTALGHDMRVLVTGDSYNDLVRGPKEDPTGEWKKARPLALRGPVMISGWGYDKAGYPVPNNDDSYSDDPLANRSDKFKDYWLAKPDEWKVGPLDVRWNEDRQVWEAVNKGVEIVSFWVSDQDGAGGSSIKGWRYDMPPGVNNLQGGAYGKSYFPWTYGKVVSQNIDCYHGKWTDSFSYSNNKPEKSKDNGWTEGQIIAINMCRYKADETAGYSMCMFPGSVPKIGIAYRDTRCLTQEEMDLNVFYTIEMQDFVRGIGAHSGTGVGAIRKWKAGGTCQTGVYHGGSSESDCYTGSGSCRSERPIYMADIWNPDLQGYEEDMKQVFGHDENGVATWYDLASC